MGIATNRLSRRYLLQVTTDTVADFTLDHAHSDWDKRLVHEPEVCDVMRRFVQRGDYVIDAGANIGFFTLLLSKLVGDDGAVAAFEPDRNCYDVLRRNVERNGVTNVGLGRQALWSSDCQIPFWIVDEACGYSSFQRLEYSTRSQMVLARALDTLLPNLQPRLIKLDCEGAEGHILRGARNMLGRGVDCVIVEFNFYLLENFRFDFSEWDIRVYMSSLGYACFLLEEGYKPTLVPSGAKLVSSDGLPVNVMFTPVGADRINKMWEN